MNKILLPIDFSNSTSLVIDYVKKNLLTDNVEVNLLNVVNEPGYISFEDIPVILPEGWLEDIKKAASSKLENLKKSFPSNIKITTDVKPTTGPIYEAIIDHANNKSSSLIVVGTHGRNLVERFILGSVTEKLLRSSKVPILVIPSVK